MGRLLISDNFPVAEELLAPFLTLIITRLRANASILISLGGSNVYEGADPEDKPPSGRWLTVSYERPVGSIPELNEGWLMPRLWVKTESRRSLDTEAAALGIHTGIHADIASSLLNYRPTLTGGANGGEGRIYQREAMSQGIEYDAVDETYFFASFFSTRIIPAQV